MKLFHKAGREALLLLMAVTAMLYGVPLFGQNAIKGTVVDGNGEVIIGAAIMVPGTNTGSITDADGTFQINVAAGTALEVSCLGYATVTVPAANGMRVILTEDTTFLDDVVVVGYGSMRKKDLTGAVVQIKTEELADENPNTVQDLLRGQAGLQIGYDASAKGGGSI